MYMILLRPSRRDKRTERSWSGHTGHNIHIYHAHTGLYPEEANKSNCFNPLRSGVLGQNTLHLTALAITHSCNFPNRGLWLALWKCYHKKIIPWRLRRLGHYQWQIERSGFDCYKKCHVTARDKTGSEKLARMQAVSNHLHLSWQGASQCWL